MNKEKTLGKLKNGFYFYKLFSILGVICCFLTFPMYIPMMLSYLFVMILGSVIIKDYLRTNKVRPDLNNMLVINNLRKFDEYYKEGGSKTFEMTVMTIEAIVMSGIVYWVLNF